MESSSSSKGFSVKALIKLLPTASGGRVTAVWGSYRPTLDMGDRSTFAEIRVDGEKALEPGESGEFCVRFLIADYFPCAPKKGDTFFLREGPKKTATGEVTEVIGFEE